MTHTDDALTEAVVTELKAVARRVQLRCETGGWDDRTYEDPDVAASRIIAAVRAHDEQSALNCGHCSEPDEIACACQIKERDDE